jgi:hypothetical protein
MIARAVGVQSPTTINQWDNKEMTEEAIMRRLQKKARARKFSDLEERVLCGWVIYKVRIGASTLVISPLGPHIGMFYYGEVCRICVYLFPTIDEFELYLCFYETTSLESETSWKCEE